jgi:hypothetical protein
MVKDEISKIEKIFKGSNKWKSDNTKNLTECKGNIWAMYGDVDSKLRQHAREHFETIVSKDEKITYDEIKEEAFNIVENVLSEIEKEATELTFKSEILEEGTNFKRRRYSHEIDKNGKYAIFSGCHYSGEEIKNITRTVKAEDFRKMEYIFIHHLLKYATLEYSNLSLI